MAIIYAVFSVANWFAPPVVAFMGPRFTLISGGICYALFIAQLTYPNDIMLYGASALIGLGAAMIWVAQGNFLTLNSDPATMERNSGIFWAMLQCSLLIGNTFFYFQLRDTEQIDRATRLTVSTDFHVYFKIRTLYVILHKLFIAILANFGLFSRIFAQNRKVSNP